MAAVLEDEQFGIRDLAGEEVRRRRGAEQVVPGRHGERRSTDPGRIDSGGPTCRAGIPEHPRGPLPHRHDRMEHEASPVPFGGGHPVEKRGLGCQQRAHHAAGGQPERRPEPQVRSEEGAHQPLLHRREVHRVRAGKIRCRHEKDEAAAASGMTERDLHRRKGAGRGPGDRRAVDPEMVEEIRHRVGLGAGPRVRGKRRAEIPEP